MRSINRLVYVFLIFLISFGLKAQILDASWNKLVQSEDSEWLASSEAMAIADNVLLFQKNIGGWPKNKQPQRFTLEEKRKLELEKGEPLGATIDNGATTKEMLFLAKVFQRTHKEKYRAGFLRGLDYLLAAQYASGGWPQYYPLRKGYYSHITYNDDAMVNVLTMLKDIYDSNKYDYITISKERKDDAKDAFQNGIDCILKTQYIQNGTLTAWCAQHDENTLEPAKARAYELPSLSGSESANITLLLMKIEDPSKPIIDAIEAAVAWFRKTELRGLRKVQKFNSAGKVIEKRMIIDSTAGSFWGRFMELDDNTPFFCDRDGIKKYAITEIGEERRNGYKWYAEEPLKVLKSYPEWRKKNIVKNIDIYNISVAKDGTGDFTTIQEAIHAAKGFPDKRVTIMVKNGVYNEKVEVYEWNSNMRIIGEDREKTIITYDDYFDKLNLGRNSTFHTPTFLVQGNDFLLKNVTVENTAGKVGQAVALAIHANRVKIENCAIRGNQDTLYITGEGFKHYFKACYIEGTTDFIFGQATALFENCEIHSKSNSFITAASTPEHIEFGYVFKNCNLTGEKDLDSVYLGRPWRTYAKTVFIECIIGGHIAPEGWDNWSNQKAESASFYAEYKNSGPGYQPEKRVKWAHQLSKSEAMKYSTERVLGEIDHPTWFVKDHTHE